MSGRSIIPDPRDRTGPPGGDEFGDYVLIRRLGIGGMSEVHLARPRDPARAHERYAVKRLLPELAQVPDVVRMFERETWIATLTDHPSLVRVVDVGVLDDRCFIVTEYVPGLDCWKITRRLSRQGERLGLAEAIPIAAAVLAALDHLHHLHDSRGRPLNLVHRDVTPSNILVSRHGDVKLGDLGVAFVPSDEAETRRRRRLRGKIRFLSPEQIAGADVDARSDLFAVGVLFTELLLGRSPFGGDTDLAVLLNVRDARLEDPAEFDRRVPESLRPVVLRALSRKPDERYPAAAALRDDLLEFAHRAGLLLDPGPLAAVVDRLIRPGDVGDDDVLRATLTPLENAPIAPRESEAPERTTLPVPTIPYVVRRSDGTATHAMNFARFVEGVMTGEFGSLEQVSVGGAPFVPLCALPEACTHIPRTSRTTLGFEPPLAPDHAGRIDADTVAGPFLRFAAAKETGLALFEMKGLRKEVYFIDGHPAYASSNLKNERLDEFLLARGVIDRAGVEAARALLPRHHGRLENALLALELIAPLSLYDHLADQTRHRILDLFHWNQGTWTFFRDVRCDRGFALLHAGPELLREGIERILREGDEEEWWLPTAPLQLVRVAAPDPPLAWWTLRENDRVVLDAIEPGLHGRDVLPRALERAPHLGRAGVIRGLHFCLTAGLAGLAHR